MAQASRALGEGGLPSAVLPDRLSSRLPVACRPAVTDAAAARPELLGLREPGSLSVRAKLPEADSSKLPAHELMRWSAGSRRVWA